MSLPPPPHISSPYFQQYARSVHTASQAHPQLQCWVRLPLDDQCWRRWNLLRTSCEHSALLTPLLELGENIPSLSALQNWRGEGVAAILIPLSVFCTDSSGKPSLSRVHELFLVQLLALDVRVILRPRPFNDAEALQDLRPFHDYIQQLAQDNSDDLMPAIARDFRDFLQVATSQHY